MKHGALTLTTLLLGCGTADPGLPPCTPFPEERIIYDMGRHEQRYRSREECTDIPGLDMAVLRSADPKLLEEAMRSAIEFPEGTRLRFTVDTSYSEKDRIFIFGRTTKNVYLFSCTTARPAELVALYPEGAQVSADLYVLEKNEKLVIYQACPAVLHLTSTSQ